MHDERALRSAISADDWSVGPADAPVTLLEYGDLECPYCGRLHPEVTALLDAYPDQLRFVFRHFPITSLHPHAQAAALATEAAGAQGKFWEMEDLIFTHQRALSNDDLRSYAEQIGLDLARFEHDLSEQRYAAEVRQDFRNGVNDGVNGTPTLFLNGMRYDGPRDREALSAAIDELLGS
jgi:protein-disulfide isomerase